MRAFALRVNPQYAIKLKHNTNVTQGAGINKNDDASCGQYCLLFLHNLINNQESYKNATYYKKKEDQ